MLLFAHIVNNVLLALDIIVLSFCTVIYFLNVFKKKSLFERLNLQSWYCEDAKVFVLIVLFFGTMLTTCHLLQGDKFMNGFSVGSVIQGIMFAVFGFITTVDSIRNWFKNIPES